MSGTTEEKPDPQVGIELGDRIAALATRISIHESEFLRDLLEFDRARWWQNQRKRSCADWLSCRLGISLVTAREKVRVARALEVFTEVREGFAKGTLNYSQAREITRARVEDQAILIEAAREGTGARLTLIGQDLRRRRAAKKPPRAAERFVRWRTHESGMVSLEARLLPEEGQIVRSALEAAARQAAKGPDDAVASVTPIVTPIDEVHAARPAEAGVCEVELDTAPAKAVAPIAPVEIPPVAPVIPEQTSLALGPQKLADGFMSIMEGSIQAPGVGAFSLRHELGVLVDLSVLAGVDRGGDAERASLLQGMAIPAETARRLACHGTLRRIVTDERGLPLDLGRRYRTVSDSQLWALWVRDGGCSFPGCTTRIHLQAHHAVPWAEGGATDLENLVLDCRYHHWLVHEGRYKCRRINGRTVYFDPQGFEVRSEARLEGPREKGPPRGAAAGTQWKEVQRWVDRILGQSEAIRLRESSDRSVA